MRIESNSDLTTAERVRRRMFQAAAIADMIEVSGVEGMLRAVIIAISAEYVRNGDDRLVGVLNRLMALGDLL